MLPSVTVKLWRRPGTIADFCQLGDGRHAALGDNQPEADLRRPIYILKAHDFSLDSESVIGRRISIR